MIVHHAFMTRTISRPRKGIGGEVTHTAMAEGAIEGTHEDYRVSTPFDTNFKFSRFNARGAMPPRAVGSNKTVS
jgi:hypothetical protein